MKLITKIYQYLLFNSGYYLYRYKTALKNYVPHKEWLTRIEDAECCKDNTHIDRVNNAGVVIGNNQIMHNGIIVQLGSYYGYGYTQLLQRNKGVHEPQEERVFQEVLKFMPEGATMIELGSFWAFYSLWFQQKVKNAKNFMVEPEYLNLLKGKKNFNINKFKGTFVQAFAGKNPLVNKTQIPTITIDNFLNDNKISKLNILHSDIQGEEFNMLKGSVKSLSSGAIDFLFISTHSEELHIQCSTFLESFDYEIIAYVNISQSFSVDGILVAKRKGINGPNYTLVDLKNQLG